MQYELRWFYNQSFDDIKNWWNIQDVPYNDEGQRTDYYIFIPNENYIGIKIREGRLEVKWRIPNSQKKFETLQLEGLMEQWVKWSWSDSKPLINDTMFNFLSEYPKGPVIKILKRRLSRKFKLCSNDIYKPAEWVDISESGFSVELTEITVEESRWWSIGFETLGNKSDLESFQSEIKKMTSTIPMKLKLENSFGYPQWICKAFEHLLDYL
jgi:hypothetical protein